MGARVRHVLVSGSYSSTVLSTRCATVGWMAGLVAPGAVVAPPITYILPPTVAATAAPRLVGMGAKALQEVFAGSFSNALSIGVQAARFPISPAVNPPKTYILPFNSVK